jgi:hypothetical protein
MLGLRDIPGDVQIIEKEGQPEWAVIPYPAYQRLLAELETFQCKNLFEQATDEYDETKDTLIALLQGPTDLAERHEEILREEAQPYSGWTRKAPLK